MGKDLSEKHISDEKKTKYITQKLELVAQDKFMKCEKPMFICKV